MSSLRNLKFLNFVLIFLLICCCKYAKAGHFSRTSHNLSCYTCNTLTDGESCRYLQRNNTDIRAACKPHQMFCSVILFQYSVDSSTDYLFYSLQRHCEETCQEGCSTVGERIKLFLCRSCCNGYLCNHGNAAKMSTVPSDHCLFFVTCMAIYRYFSYLNPLKLFSGLAIFYIMMF